MRDWKMQNRFGPESHVEWSFVTMAWHNLGLQMEKKASRYEYSCEYIENMFSSSIMGCWVNSSPYRTSMLQNVT
jgi:hypothetical protein